MNALMKYKLIQFCCGRIICAAFGEGPKPFVQCIHTICFRPHKLSKRSQNSSGVGWRGGGNNILLLIYKKKSIKKRKIIFCIFSIFNCLVIIKIVKLVIKAPRGVRKRSMQSRKFQYLRPQKIQSLTIDIQAGSQDSAKGKGREFRPNKRYEEQCPGLSKTLKRQYQSIDFDRAANDAADIRVSTKSVTPLNKCCESPERKKAISDFLNQDMTTITYGKETTDISDFGESEAPRHRQQLTRPKLPQFSHTK